MPYIKQEYRNNFDSEIKELVKNIVDPGDLCYVVYKLLND